MKRKIVILTEGFTNPLTAKTASSVIRYGDDEVIALLDSTVAGETAQSLLGVGGDIPVVASLDDAPNTDLLMLGIAPPGGSIPANWRAVILEAISRGMDVTAGLHDFLNDDQEFAAAAAKHGVTLTDVRKNEERSIARRIGLRGDCLRVLTVGHDCSVGKMLTSIELTKGLKAAGRDAHFIATGQTGIMIAGEGSPIDRVIGDFVSGAVEKLILKHQHHDILMVEGQGSLVHPSYSGVTLSLLHGAAPQALILAFELGRETIMGLGDLRIPPLAKIRELNETMGSIHQPCRVIGMAVNTRGVTADEAAAARIRLRAEFDLPVCDVIRDGPQELIDAIVAFRESDGWRS